MTAIAPFCPIEVSEATPIASGNTVPPKSPIIYQTGNFVFSYPANKAMPARR